MAMIESVHAREVLDSRGFPTVEVEVSTEEHTDRAMIPSGASTGDHEVLELRDKDQERYRGKGVLTAVNNVITELHEALTGKFDVADQAGIDDVMLKLDGTDNKERLGANAILGVSLACARVAAKERGLSLYRHLNPNASLLPTPMMNIMNGGRHAKSGLDIQEFMVVPVGASTFRDALRTGSEIFHALRDILNERDLSTGVGDEGGFAPDMPNNEEAIRCILDAIAKTRYKVGTDVVLALDAAASEFFLPRDAPRAERKYHIKVDGKPEQLTTSELVDFYDSLVGQFPIVSIEDGLDQDDWEGWRLQAEKLSSRIQLVGDDIFVTNPDRLQRGIDERSANAVLIKPNQIGTLTETIGVIKRASHAGLARVISHRSGETEDTFIADFAVAMETGQIKTGAPSRGERTAKYNQLLRIEEDLGRKARYEGRRSLAVPL